MPEAGRSSPPCPSCRVANPAGGRFCAHCGAALALRCPGCGAATPVAARHCPHCARPLAWRGHAPGGGYTPEHLARKILTTRAAVEGERKLVTVLFADVKGSMELARELDAEEWHRLLDRLFRILTASVHRFEGTVNQYTGDGIMALFGAPVAHEDHAQRACHAALDAQDALRYLEAEVRREHDLSLAVRMGLNSGEVVVGKIGDDLRMDYTAQGHTVGLASRVEEVAEPGGVYLSQATAELVRGYFRLEERGAFDLAGIDEPVAISALRGVGPVQTRLEAARRRGLSRFVGRQDALSSLSSALVAAARHEGRVLGIVGPPGVGKSRLCHEFAERSRGDGVIVHETRCPPPGLGAPLQPIVELLRSLLGLDAASTPSAARDLVDAALAEGDDDFPEERAATRLVVLELLRLFDPGQAAIPVAPEERQRRLGALTSDLLRRSGGSRPTVVLIDDVHAIDAGSETCLQHLTRAAESARALLLLNFRPGYQAAWMQSSRYQQLPLAPLDETASGELLASMLGPDPTLAPVVQTLYRRAAGNPLFMEELVRSLVEAGHLRGDPGALRLAHELPQIGLPSTIRALVAARIDRLPEREKEVLQQAAVIGPTFTPRLLVDLLDLDGPELTDSLRRLRVAELIRESGGGAPGELAFEHPLTQEVAYRSQLAERRAAKHVEVALALERRGERLGELAHLIAHHWEAAGRRYQAARWRGFAALRVSNIQVRRRRRPPR